MPCSTCSSKWPSQIDAPVTTIPGVLKDDPLADLKSLLRPTVRFARGRLSAMANDGLVATGQAPRFPEPIREQWGRVLQNSEAVLDQWPELTGPRVLFATVWGANNALTVIDSVVAMALRLRGAAPTILACDMQLPACEQNSFGNHLPSPQSFGPSVTERTQLDVCRDCSATLRDSHRLPGLSWATFSDVRKDDDLERVQALVDALPYEQYRELRYEGIAVGEHAYASVCRATLRGDLEDTPRTRHLFMRFLCAAILTVDLGGRIFDRVQPERLVAAHGIYVTQGTLCELARQRGIHVVVFGTPYRHGTVWLCHDDTYHRVLVTQPNDRWERFEMTPERSRIAEDYLESKHLVPRDYASYHVHSLTDPERIREQLGLDERPIVSLFTNILWDAQLFYRFNAFPNMLTWVFDTIEYFAKRSDLQLVIRLHPAEARGVMPTNQPLLPEIRARFPKLPDNVKLVVPESKVSSYALGGMSRAALIYGARIGVELAVLGTPLIVAGETMVRNKGFSYDAETREQFFELLDGVADLPRNHEVRIARAKKWYYYYFFRLMLPFPFFAVDESVRMTNPRLHLSHLDELREGRCAPLDVICRGIIDGESPFEWDEVR